MTNQDGSQPGLLDLILVEDSVLDAELEVDALREDGQLLHVRRVEDETAFRAALEERLPDAILADWTLPRFSGRRALEISRERCPEVPFILVVGSLTGPTAQEVLGQEASALIHKQQLQLLKPAVLRAVTEAQTLRSQREKEARS
jgi:DNA-binding NtrC family response regulator